ncbi:MAG: hypothetical protein ACTSYF_12665, partial [Promethearchaeota archaeon]
LSMKPTIIMRVNMNYKNGIIIAIIGLIVSIISYPIAPVITYFFGSYMLFFLVFLYFTDIRKRYKPVKVIQSRTLETV